MSNKAIELKKIRVRDGHTGFYTSVLESGTIAMIPADQKATKEGWFDDVEDDEPVDIGAANVGRKNEDSKGDGTGVGGVGGGEKLSGESDPKDPTKAEIIAELESLGVQDFNRSANKAELQAKLDLVKAALNTQGE